MLTAKQPLDTTYFSQTQVSFTTRTTTLYTLGCETPTPGTAFNPGVKRSYGVHTPCDNTAPRSCSPVLTPHSGAVHTVLALRSGGVDTAC